MLSSPTPARLCSSGDPRPHLLIQCCPPPPKSGGSPSELRSGGSRPLHCAWIPTPPFSSRLPSRPLTNPVPSLSPFLSPLLLTPPNDLPGLASQLLALGPLTVQRRYSSPPSSIPAPWCRVAASSAAFCPRPSRPSLFALPNSTPLGPRLLLLSRGPSPPLPFSSCRTPNLQSSPPGPRFWLRAPQARRTAQLWPQAQLLPCLHPFSFSSRGGGAAPQKRHRLRPCGLRRPVRTRFAALAGLPLRWPQVPLRGRPGGQELGAHSRALREQVGGAPQGSHGGAVEAGPGEAAGRAGALEGMDLSELLAGVSSGGLPAGGEAGLGCGLQGAL